MRWRRRLAVLITIYPCLRLQFPWTHIKFKGFAPPYCKDIHYVLSESPRIRAGARSLSNNWVSRALRSIGFLEDKARGVRGKVKGYLGSCRTRDGDAVE
ncbi:hypothetical protein BC826DRAFT_991245 [Russula brevipes]|nr:hypothetical protein BC826DRAFT_991245 [Russula brevipes]